MLQIDRTNINATDRDTPLRNGLEEFALQISMANPLFSFKVDPRDSFYNVWDRNTNTSNKCIGRLEVIEDGDLVGCISTDDRRRGHETHLVYGVESFRIQKERGARNTTYSKDIKVALRLVKKNFIPRDNTEIKDLMRNIVSGELNQLHSRATGEVRWNINMADEALFYCLQAYRARKRGEGVTTLPSKIASVSNMETHDKACEALEITTNIWQQHSSSLGYRVQVREDNSICVHDLVADTLTRYRNHYDLSIHIQNALSVFKVLEKNEPIEQFGVKLIEGFYYIVPEKK